MRCAWQELIYLLPQWMREQTDRLGKATLQEIRMRLRRPPELICQTGSTQLSRTVTGEDLAYVVNAASRYSPWAAATAAKGYITAQGGHRIGLCGQAVLHEGIMSGIKDPTSLCIRVARDFPGIGQKAAAIAGSVLIIGSPGCGKTTLLRDLIRQRGSRTGKSIAVVDERGELFPWANGASCFDTGSHTDILTGCGKATGIDTVLRTMGPACIAVDEITAQEDTQALIGAAWSGVDLLATAHASSTKDLMTRTVYRPLVETRLFDTLLVLNRDKSWHTERMEQ